ncbi:hypothetical protein [Deinococcus sp.]|nr:hypothetical protein [Deinococcus sp.]
MPVFARIRSYISTLHKQRFGVWEGLVSVFTGDLLMPDFTRWTRPAEHLP